jgi:ribosome maturation factor RimP
MDNLVKMKEVAKQICEREGCRLYDVDFNTGSKGRGRKVIVYVDKQGGVSLEDCERVSKGMGLLLDVEDVVPGGEYTLEVSSPGLERPLKEKWHFESAVGQKIFVQSSESLIPENPENYQRFKVTGSLEKVEDNSILVKSDGKDFLIPLTNVKKSHVVFEPETNSGNKNNKKRKN